jgi:lysophospholipase L1-like esterase
MSKKKKKYKKKRLSKQQSLKKIQRIEAAQKKSKIELFTAIIVIAVLVLSAVIIGLIIFHSGDTSDIIDVNNTDDTAVPAWNELNEPKEIETEITTQPETPAVITEPQIQEIPETTEIPETLETPTISETVELTETIETIEVTTIAEVIETTVETTQPPPVATIPATTAPPPPTTTSPPATAAPELIPTPAPMVYNDTPQSNFLQKMFENAFEIPEISKFVEQPPYGRSIELQSKIVPLSAEIPEPFEYFKNIIFLGDSVTSGFDLFKSRIKYDGQNVLRDVNVVAAVSYGVFNSAKEISVKSIHPLYEGKQMMPEDIIAQMDANMVFICLGLNDLGGSIDNYLEYYKYLVDRVKWKNPDKTVVIMSVTPTVEGSNANLNNQKIMAANDALIQYASENNIPFMDYGAALRDGNNSLYKSLASDGYCHLTIEGYNRLVEYILHHPIM